MGKVLKYFTYKADTADALINSSRLSTCIQEAVSENEVKKHLLCLFSCPEHWQQQDSGERFNHWGQKTHCPSPLCLHRHMHAESDRNM